MKMERSPLPNRLPIGRLTNPPNPQRGIAILFLLAIGTFANPCAFAGDAFRVEASMLSAMAPSHSPSTAAMVPPLGDRGILAVDPGQIAADQTICGPSGTPAELSSTTPASGHDGYLWEHSTDNGATWNPAPAPNDQETYQPGTLTETTQFRRVALSATDGDAPTDPVTVTVSPIPPAPAIPAPYLTTQHLCKGQTLADLHISGDNIRWYATTTGGSPLPDTTPLPAGTSTFYASQTVDGCESAARTKITARAVELTPGQISGSTTICRGNNVNINGNPGGQNPTSNSVNGLGHWYYLQWEQSTDGGSTWTNVPGGSVGQGHGYSVIGLQNDAKFRRKTYHRFETEICPVYSEEVTIKVNWADGGEVAGTQAICSRELPQKKLTNVQSGTVAPGATRSYVWKSLNHPADDWNTPVGYEEEYQSVQSNKVHSFRYIRWTISDLNGHVCEAASNIVYINMHSLANAGSISGAHTICQGEEAESLTSLAEAQGQTGFNLLDGVMDTITYGWQKTTPGGEWTDIPGETGATLNAPGKLYETTQFRRMAFSTLFGNVCSRPSQLVEVKVNRVSAGTIIGDQAICKGGSAGGLSSKNNDGGFGGGYWWQKSPTGDPNGNDWEIIPGQTGSSHQPGILEADTWFRRGIVGTVNDVVCRDTSNVVKVTINHIDPGTISASQIVCPDGVPDELVSATSATGLSTPTYEWYIRDYLSGIWSKINGATGETHQPVLPSARTHHIFRRAFSSVLIGGTLSFCQADSDPVTVTVNPINAGAIGGTQTVCQGVASLPLSSSSVATGAGDITYRWEYSTDGWATFDIIPGTNPKEGSYSPGVLAQTTAFRRVAIFEYSDGTKCEIATTPVTVTVNWVTAGTIAADQTICKDGTPDPLFSMASGDGLQTVSYVWRRSTDGGTTWSGNIAGQTGAGYAPGPLTATTLFKRIATSSANGRNCSADAAPVTITVNTLDAGMIAGTQTICEGATPDLLTSQAVGSSSLGGAVTYRWEQSTDNGTTWNPAPGANTGETYQPGALFATTRFRRVAISAMGGDCETASSPVTIIVTVVSAPTGTAEQVFCAADAPTVGNLKASGASIRWYADPTGGTPLLATAPLQDGTFYYASRTASGCESLSRLAVKAVLNDTDGGTIAADQTICANTPAALLTSAAEASGKGALDYYWQRSTNGGTSWTNISVTDGEYAPGILNQTTMFRRAAVFTLGGVACTVFSNPVTVTVNKVAAGTIQDSHVVCPGSTPGLLTSLIGGVADGARSYYWEGSTDGGTNWSPIANAEDDFYQPPVLAQTTMFRRVTVSTLNGRSCEAASNPVTITVNAVAGGTISGNQTICEGATPTALTSNMPGIGQGSISYYWKASTDGGTTWSPVTGAVGPGYAPGPLSVTTIYRRMAVSTIGNDKCEVESNPVTVTVKVIPAPVGDAVQTFCGTGATIADLQPSGGTVKWYDAPIGGTHLPDGTPLTHNVTYYATQTEDGCEGVARLAVTVALNTLSPGSIGGGQTICLGAGAAAALNSTASATGVSGADVTYRWEYSTNGGNSWTPITGTLPKAGSYSPGVVSETTMFRRVAIAELNGLKCEAEADPVTVTVNSVLAGSISADQTICVGGTPTALVSTDPGGGDGTLGYQWQRSTNGGTNWTTITAEIGDGYAPTALSVTTMFRRVMVGEFGSGKFCEAETDPITITVNAVDAGTIAGTQTICEGDTPSLLASDVDGSSAAGGSIAYQWQSRPIGGTWADISGETGKDHQPLALFASREYRRIAISSLNGRDCRDTTTAIIVTVTVVSSPVGDAVQVFCAADAPTVANLSAAGASIKWYDASSGGFLVLPTTLLAHNTTYYVSRTANSCEGLARLAVTALLNDTDGGEISANQTICAGDVPDLLASANDGSGEGAISYYWLRSTDGGTNWTPIPGAEDAFYQPGALSITTMFRRVTVSTIGTNTCEAEADAVTIAINWATGGSISSDRTVCTGAVPVLLTSLIDGSTAPGGSLSYRWEMFPEGAADWSPIAGAEDEDYLPNILTVTTQFRRVAISTLNGKPCEALSNTVILTVNKVDGGPISGTQAVCFGTAPMLLTSTKDGIADGVRSYYWEMFPDGATDWTRIPGATDKDYLPDALLGETKYRRATVSKLNDVACEDFSGEVTVTVTVAPAPTGNATQIFCAEDEPTVADLQATGTFIKWYALASGGTPLSALAPLANGTAYYASQAVAGCESAARLKVTALLNTVNPGTISGEQTICSDTRPAMLGNSAVAAGLGSISYRWESSTDGWMTWDIIPGTPPKVATYWPTKLTVTTEFRRVAISTTADGVCEAVSAPVTVWVNDIYGGAISADQTICAGSVPNTIVSDILPNGSGSITYFWEVSVNGSSWAKISGAEAEEYTPGPLSTTTMFRRGVTSDLNGRLCTDWSNAVTITVNQVSSGAITAHQTICQGDVPKLLASATDGSADGALTYLWEHSTDNGTTWNPAPGTNDEKDYQPGALSVTTQFRRVAFSTKDGVECPGLSNEVTVSVTVISAPTGSAEQIFCEADAPTVADLKATGASIKWYDVPVGGAPLSAATAELSHNKTYYATRTAAGCESVARLEVTAVLNDVDGGAISADQTLCQGDVPGELLSDTDGNGSGAISYYWQRSTDGGANWVTIPGATLKDYQPDPLSATAMFRRVTVSTLKGMPCEALSNIITLAVNGVSPGAIAGNQTLCLGTPPKDDLTSATDGDGAGTISYYWESSTDGGATWALVSGANATTYLPPALPETTLFRRVAVSTLNGKSCEAASSPVTITVLTDCDVVAKKTVTDANKNGLADGGEELTYAITVTNNFDRPVTVTVTDAIPANTTYVASSAGGTHSGGSIAWHNAVIPANSDGIFTFIVKVADNLTGISEIKNTATVTGDPAEMPVPQTPEADIQTLPKLAHTATKIVTDADGDAIAQPKEELTYTITVANTGTVDLEGVVVSDLIPAGTTYVPGSVTENGVLTSGTPDRLDWTFDIPFGQQVELLFKAKVVDDPKAFKLISNTATVRGEKTPAAEIPVDIGDGSSMSLTKTVVDPTRIYDLGDKIAYIIRLENTGIVDLTNIVVTDNNADDPNVGTVPILAAGAPPKTFTAWHTVTAADVAAGSVLNIASATGKNPDGYDVVRKSKEAVAHTAAPPGMSVTKKVADRTKKYGLGSVIDYQITVKNTGKVDLTDITVTDNNADNPNVGFIPVLAPGALEIFSAQHTVTLADLDKGRVDNIAVAVGEDPDGNEVSQSSEDPDCSWCPSTGVPVDPGNSYGLEVTKTADRSKEYANVGDVIEYRIRVENKGGGTLMNVTLVDANADGNQEVEYKELSGTPQVFVVQHTVTPEDIDRGYVYNIVLAKAKTSDGKTARARSVDGDPCTDCPVDPGCPDCTVVPIKQETSIKLVKNVDNPDGPYGLGDKIAYTITVENTGNVPVYGISVTDSNADIKNVGVIPVLPAGEKHIFLKVEHTVTQDDVDAEYVLNLALAEGSTSNGKAVTAESSPTVPSKSPIDPNCPTCTAVKIWQEDPSMSLFKDVADDAKTYRLGDVIEYTITVVNTGNVDLTDIAVTDDNADIKNVGVIKLLPAGGTELLTARHTVTPADVDRGHVLNIAKASGYAPSGAEVIKQSSSRNYSADDDPVDPDCPTCTVTELATIKAVDDLFEVTWPTDRSVGGSVLDNDRLNGEAVDPAEVLLELLTPDHIGLRMDSRTGTIAIDPVVMPGTYAYPYRICEVADPSSCSDALAVIEVRKSADNEVFIPNMFTPDGDGVNDTFEILGIESLNRVDLLVINRWGSEVYRSDDYRNEWAGEGLNNGTYYYIVTLHRKDGTSKVVKGAVLLLR